jgi:hypothetical protein
VDRRQQQEGIPIAFNYDALALFSDALNDTSRVTYELIKRYPQHGLCPDTL